MIEITKQEVKYFQDKGYDFPNPLNKSKTKHCKYYLTENPKLVKMLEELRKSKITR